MNWMPDRKIAAGGLAGLAAFAITATAAHFGYDLQPMADAIFPPPGTVSVLAVLTGGIGALIAYVTPPADKDIVKRLNDRLVAMAQADPNIPVSPPLPPKDPRI